MVECCPKAGLWLKVCVAQRLKISTMAPKMAMKVMKLLLAKARAKGKPVAAAKSSASASAKSAKAPKAKAKAAPKAKAAAKASATGSSPKAKAKGKAKSPLTKSNLAKLTQAESKENLDQESQEPKVSLKDKVAELMSEAQVLFPDDSAQALKHVHSGLSKLDKSKVWGQANTGMSQEEKEAIAEQNKSEKGLSQLSWFVQKRAGGANFTTVANKVGA